MTYIAYRCQQAYGRVLGFAGASSQHHQSGSRAIWLALHHTTHRVVAGPMLFFFILWAAEPVHTLPITWAGEVALTI